MREGSNGIFHDPEISLISSFPVEQTAIDAGKVLTWTKGFSATGAIGNDVVKLLQDSLDRKHIHVRCSALVNDVSRLSFAFHDTGIPLLPYWRLTRRPSEPSYLGHIRTAPLS